MSDSEQQAYVPVSRELLESGLLPWAGPRYAKRLTALVRSDPYDPRIVLVSPRLLEIYKDHAPANARITAAEARTLGLETASGSAPDSLLSRLRRALGNSD